MVVHDGDEGCMVGGWMMGKEVGDWGWEVEGCMGAW